MTPGKEPDQDTAQAITRAIAALEAQRAALGDDVVEAALAPMREKLKDLTDQKEPTGLAAERKLVTVMFAGVSGFTTLAETLDPAQVRDLMNACFDHLIPVIEKYTGTVDKFVGDTMMALFGAPITHENDPERALRAALEMIEAIAAFNALHGTDLDLRIGVNTGTVIAGSLGTRDRQEYSVMGDVVNLAARLEDSAERGQILVGPDTFRLTSPRFDFEFMPPIQVKDKEEPIFVHHLQGIKTTPSPTRGIEGLSAPLIGRDAELLQLETALDALEQGQGGLLAVVGEAGIGKSRLVAQVRDLYAAGSSPPDSVPPEDTPRQRLDWVEGRALSYTTGMSYWIARDVLRSLIGAPAGTPLDQTEAARPSSIERPTPEQFAKTYPYLARLLDLPLSETIKGQLDLLTPETMQREIVAAYQQYLRARALQRPLVLVWEDLQWADPSSLNLLESLFSLCRELPLLVILVFRPEEERIEAFYERIVADYGPFLQVVDLAPLTYEESTLLMYNLLRTEQIPEKTGAQILDKAAGNPFFLEELLRSLVDVEMLRLRGDRAVTIRAIGELDVPDTLQGVIMARMDRLPAQDKRTLQTAAVIGRVFQKRLLAHMLKASAGEIATSLSELRRRAFIRQRAAERPGVAEQEYIFKNALIQEVAYHSLLAEQRRQLHMVAGEAIEVLYFDRLDELVATLAYHYSKAAEGGKAAEYLLQAGDRARQLYAHREAIDHYERALAFQKEGQDYERAARTLIKMALTYHTAFDFQHARQAYEEGFTLWQQAGELEPTAPLPPAPHPLRIAWSDPPTLDPTMAWDVYSSGVIDQLFSGLVELSPELDVVPGVARTWEVLENGRTYAFYLREDVRWSDGTPVTAGDFEYAWRRVLDPATGSPAASLLYDVKGAWAFHQGMIAASDHVGVHCLDDLTLIVDLEEPTSYFPHLLTYFPTYAVPRHVVERHGDSWTELGTIVTNGPFTIEGWQRGDSIALVRNPDYYGRFTGNVERVELSLLSDRSLQLQSYEDDRLDTLSLSVLPAAERNLARQRHVGEYISGPLLGTTFLGFDASRAPFDDPRVRRAFVLATDRGKLADVILDGYEFPATGGYIPPGAPGHSTGIGLPFDPERARQLLAEAGRADSRDFPAVEAVTSAGYTSLSVYLSSQWRENLGVEIRWEIVDWVTFLDRLNQGLLNMFLAGWIAPYPDPDNFLRISPAWRQTRWQDEDYAWRVEQARRITDQGERMELYRQADRILVEQAPIMPLTYRRLHLLVKPWVRKYPTSGIKQWFWKDVIVESHT